MKSTFKILSLVAISALALPSLTNAAPKKAAEEKTAAAEKAADKPKKDTYPLYGEVVSLDKTTLVIKGGKETPDRKYAITKDTKFVSHPKGGESKDVTAADVKVGAWVGGLLKKATSGSDEVVSLNISVKQKEAKTEATKPEAKTETPKKKKAA